MSLLQPLLTYVYLLAAGLLPGALVGTAAGFFIGYFLDRGAVRGRLIPALGYGFPWRTAAAAAGILAVAGPAGLIGLGKTAAMAGMAFFGLITGFVLTLEAGIFRRVPRSLPLMALNSLRTVLVTGGAFALVLSLIGYGGLGKLVVQGLMMMDVGQLFTGAAAALLVLLGLDLLLGLIQLMIYLFSAQPEPASESGPPSP